MASSDGNQTVSPLSLAREENHDLPLANMLRTLASGDDQPLAELMNRYDRLVRYTIFSVAKDICMRDPQWLDSIASETWVGLMASLKRNTTMPTIPTAFKSYLVNTARNRAISSLRSRSSRPGIHNELNANHDPASNQTTPETLISNMEQLSALRECMASLDTEDQALTSHLVAITDRKWREVAERCGQPESTVRSRWKRICARLRDCVREKSGTDFAPD